jgi:tetratricopeptide (TPR) repeat protein
MTARIMRRRLPALVLTAMLLVPAVTPSWAQKSPDDSDSYGPQWVHPPRDLPQAEHGDHTYSLDTLFDALKIAPDEDSAKAIEDRIWAKWMVSGSDTCNLLMERVNSAADGKDYDLAIKLLDAIIEIRPNYVEAWNRRATLYYLKQDYGHALADIREVLAREPRHFGALAGLGVILQDVGDDKDALEAYRKALAINPHLDHIPDVVKDLAVKVEGRNI